MSRPHTPRLESLEDRLAPATFGIAWPAPEGLTFSFVPDGTALEGGTSQLFQFLDQAAPPQVWQEDVLRALEVFARDASINIGLVPDQGQPLGQTGQVQGDPRFGDIRLAAAPLSPEVLAVASPFDPVAGTWSGDVVLNTNADIGPGRTFDLTTVLLHEFGHSFGLDHSPDPLSPLFEDYTGVKTDLPPSDVARLQQLYGPRQPDTYESPRPNDTLADATPLSVNSSGPTVIQADRTTGTDVDWYRFTLPGGVDSATVSVQTAGHSLLAARLTIVPEGGTATSGPDMVTASGPGEDLQQVVRAQGKNRTFLVRVDGVDSDFDVGGYGLEIDPDGAGNARPTHDPGSSGQGQSRSPQSPIINLQARTYRTDGRFSYAVADQLAGATRTYRFQVRAGTEANSPLTVVGWATEDSGFRPLLTLRDGLGNVVPASVLVNQDGSFVLQAVPGKGGFTPGPYLLDVSPGGVTTPDAEQGYFVGIGFDTPVIVPDMLVQDATLPAEVSGQDAEGTLHVSQGQLLHVLLTARGGAAETGSVDAQLSAGGQAVLDLSAPSGGTVTQTLFLRPGDYSFTFTGTPGVSWDVGLLQLSNPIGPEPVDAGKLPQAPTSFRGDDTTGSLPDWEPGLFLRLVQVPAPSPSPDPGTPPSVVTGTGFATDPGKQVPPSAPTGPTAPSGDQGSTPRKGGTTVGSKGSVTAPSPGGKSKNAQAGTPATPALVASEGQAQSGPSPVPSSAPSPLAAPAPSAGGTGDQPVPAAEVVPDDVPPARALARVGSDTAVPAAAPSVTPAPEAAPARNEPGAPETASGMASSAPVPLASVRSGAPVQDPGSSISPLNPGLPFGLSAQAVVNPSAVPTAPAGPAPTLTPAPPGTSPTSRANAPAAPASAPAPGATFLFGTAKDGAAQPVLPVVPAAVGAATLPVTGGSAASTLSSLTAGVGGSAEVEGGSSAWGLRPVALLRPWTEIPRVCASAPGPGTASRVRPDTAEPPSAREIVQVGADPAEVPRPAAADGLPRGTPVVPAGRKGVLMGLLGTLGVCWLVLLLRLERPNNIVGHR